MINDLQPCFKSVVVVQVCEKLFCFSYLIIFCLFFATGAEATNNKGGHKKWIILALCEESIDIDIVTVSVSVSD